MLQSNRYQLQQMSYLQFAEKPRHVPECLRDLTAMYDAIAVPDLYQVSNQHKPSVEYLPCKASRRVWLCLKDTAAAVTASKQQLQILLTSSACQA